MRLILAALITVGLVTSALAHDHPMSQYNKVQIPSGPIEGAIFITGIGPPAGVELVHAKAHIEFTSDGTMPASEMLILVHAQINDGSKEWTITGADLGFGNTAGTYVATIDTDTLNGAVSEGLPGLGSILHIDILAQNSGLVGKFKNSYIEVEWNETLTRVGNEISVSTGGAQGLLLDFGPSYAGRTYIILGSASGTSPGISIVGRHMPLNYDAYLLFTASNPNSFLMPYSLSKLGSAGTAQTIFNVPPGLPSSVVGLTLNHAALVMDANGVKGDVVSIPVPVTFVP